MGPSIKIDIRSEGCNDPGKTPNTCGRAYIKVNDVEHAKQGRGHNVVVVDAVTGKELQCWYLNAVFFLIILKRKNLEKRSRSTTSEHFYEVMSTTAGVRRIIEV